MLLYAMNNVFERRRQDSLNIRNLITEILKDISPFLQNNFSSLNIENYEFTSNEAIEELGLDAELIDQLIGDYIKQILQSKEQFVQYLESLKIAKEKSQKLDYTDLWELAHKNLGVARNLRIIDATKILDELMKKDDLDYLELCIDALIFCIVRLNPKYAYESLVLMKIKDSF